MLEGVYGVPRFLHAFLVFLEEAIELADEYLFEPDDRKIEAIGRDYRSGKMLTGELKEILVGIFPER